jgi:hypothetical protein
MGRIIRVKHEGGSPAKRRPGGKATELGSTGKPGDGSNGSYYEPAARMQAPSFVKKYRRRIQGFLWNRAEKQGVADYLMMMEADRETTKRAAQTRPKEVRVLWAHEDETET